MRRAATAVLVLLLCCCLSSALQAQSTNASVNGYVTDSTKAAIIGGKVIAINVSTNVRYQGTTNRTGSYNIVNLSPGTYRVEVEREGFKTVVKSDIVLHVQDAVAINFEMALGSTSEVVTVVGGVPLVNTQSAAVSTVVDQTYIANMPLNGRSFQSLILLTPGTLTQGPQAASFNTPALGQAGEFSVNGQRPESNYYTVDGVSANVGAAAGINMNFAGGSGSVPAATALGTTQALVSVEALGEFRVQSSSYSAEYGRNPGGQFAFETKSGSNQWHGTTYDYLRNGFFDAADWFSNYFGVKQPAMRQNDFGATLAGPLEIPGVYNGRDRTFFFLSYEGLRLALPRAATANYVPDLCMRGLGPCPAGRSPAPSVLLPVLRAFPLPSPGGLQDDKSGIGQFIGGWSDPSSLDSTGVRLDQAVNDKLRLFARFSDTVSSLAARGLSRDFSNPTNVQTSSYTMRTYTGGATSVLTDRLSNELRLNYSSNSAVSTGIIDAFGGSTPVNLAELTGVNDTVFALIYGGYGLELLPNHTSGTQRQWNVVDSASLSLGRHQFKLGLDYRRLAPVANGAKASVFYFCSSEAAIEANNCLVDAVALAPTHLLYTNFSAFAQDQWSLSERLTLSLGLRWEVNPAPTVTQGLRPYTIQGSTPNTWTLAPQGTPLWKTTWFNFAPRLGAAYILRNAPTSETVLRGGVGIFYDTGQQVGGVSAASGPGFNVVAPFRPEPFPSYPTIPTIVNPPVPPYSYIVGYSPHLQLPYTIQWNTSIEQALGSAQAIAVSYVGAHGTRLLRESRFSVKGNPIGSTFDFWENGLTSDYNALQTQFRRRLSGGLTALASYTLSHCFDYGSHDNQFNYQRGPCDFDVRHSFSAALSYDLPNIRRGGFIGAVLGNWGIDGRFTARSGYPVTLFGRRIIDPSTGQFFWTGLDLVPGQPLYLYGANCASVLQGLGRLAPGKTCPGGRAVNPQAFASVSSGSGNAPRNFVRSFGAWQMDMAIRRDFPIDQGLRLQFRAEVFNIFNHANFGAINTVLGSSTFGQATATLASTPGALASLYQQGGPRSMQFALKLVF